MTRDRLAVPHEATPDAKPRVGWWTTQRGGETNRIVVVHLRCGNGHVGILQRRYADGTADGHEIDDTGDVNPSAQCPREDCDWHTWVTLEGWPP